MVDETSKDKALAAALSQIERQFGKGSMMRLGDSEREAIPSISTGVSKNTVVFNNLVVDIEDYNNNWEVPAFKSWHSRFF